MPDTITAAVEMIEKSTKRQHFTDVRYVTVRWEPYKPDGARQMKAKGRWQEQVGSGDYWRWQNCERPAFAHDPETIEYLRDQLAAANARADRARDNALVEASTVAKAAISGACQKCGHPRDNHTYRHPFVGRSVGDIPANILALRDNPTPAMTVQEAARVLLDQPYSVMSAAFDAMEKLHGEGADRIMAAALRAIAGGGDE